MAMKLKNDIDRDSATPQQVALAIEGMDQAEILARAGYDSLAKWITHQERDIEDGRRDPPGPTPDEIQREKDQLGLTTVEHKASGPPHRPALSAVQEATDLSRRIGERLATRERKFDKLGQLMLERQKHL